MKLYTEEQVMKFINDNFDEGCSELVGLTPIELPSDEEIEKELGFGGDNDNAISGAKWMRDKIQGG